MLANLALAEGRSPASQTQSMSGRSMPTDFCSLSCENRDSIPADLVQVYDYIHHQDGSFNYNKLVPKDLSPGQDSTTVANKIADQGVQYWWNESGAKQTPLGQNVTTVENSLKQEVDLGKSGGVHQKVNFNVDAFQTQAKLKYEGYTDAELFYQARDSSMSLQMINKVGFNKEVILRSSSDQTSAATFKWNF